MARPVRTPPAFARALDRRRVRPTGGKVKRWLYKVKAEALESFSQGNP
jgi:hypothetical protein